MVITFEISGGFAHIPGLSKPVSVDTEELPEALANELVQSVWDARFFQLPETVDTTAPGAADHFTYLITVKDDDRTHTTRLTDPIANPPLQNLVSRLQQLTRQLRT